MGLRRKNTIDVIDLTELQEKGILQKSLEIAARNNNDNLHSNEIIDLGRIITSKEKSVAGNSNMFGFLDNLASANSNGGMNNLKDNSNLGDSKLMDIKIKIDNLEYKLERLMERLMKIEEKLS